MLSLQLLGFIIITEVLGIFLIALLVEGARYWRSEMWAERKRLRPLHAELQKKRDETRRAAERLGAELDDEARGYRTRRVQELHTNQSTDLLLDVYGIGEVLVAELKRGGFRKIGDISPVILDGRVKGVGPEKGRAILSFCTRHEVEVLAQVDAEVKAGASVPESLRTRAQAARAAAEDAERAYEPIRRLYDMTRFRHAVLRSARTMRNRAREVAQRAKHALAPVTDPLGVAVPELPTAQLSDAEDIIALAVGVAASDAPVAEAELTLLELRLTDLLALPEGERTKLRTSLRRLSGSPPDVDSPAERLRARGDALRRRLTAEMLFEVAVADGTLRPEEEAVLARIFDALDVPAELFARLRQAWQEATRAATTAAAEPTPEQLRSERLAALELPPDITLTREVIDRAYHRVTQTYREDRFVGLNPEFIRLAAQHRERAEEAYRALTAQLPAEPAPPPPTPAADALRHNPSLDDIFG